ncbi:MAG: TIGR00159 family protein [Chloroflexi bacterium]|nr:MAG: TIGR00159 family protein [Phototrophicales bacterium]RMF79890.1 MAG: TIGR00159 family protein [Chloroflexota bacterium]
MELITVFESITPLAIVDILLVALVFFLISLFIRGTQAVALFRGTLFLLVLVFVVSNLLNLVAFRWLLNNLITVLAVAIPIIFQPELRRALERLGRAGLVLGPGTKAPQELRVRIVEDICRAAEQLSERRHGALIVLERNTNLQEYIRTGVPLDSYTSSELFLTIFWPKTELHDGAAIIDSDGRIAAAAAVLPLTARRNLPDRNLGTRHRAGLGISEVSDAICVIVSEETGNIAITNGGRMVPRLEVMRLRTILNAFYGNERQASPTWRDRLRAWRGTLRNVSHERRKSA